MVHGKNRIPYWIDRSLTGLAGPDYAATISFGLPIEHEDSQYGKYRIRHGTRALALLVFLYFLRGCVQCVLPKSLIELLVYVLKHRLRILTSRHTLFRGRHGIPKPGICFHFGLPMLDEVFVSRLD